MSGDDVEMKDVKIPLMENEKEIPDVEFRSSKQILKKKHDDEFHGLTKEDLEEFAKDPFWKRLRLILFILFWVIWIGMLIAAILIVVFSPKCPTRPKLQFWEQKTGYWIDPFAMADTNNDGVGDFKGIMSKLDYMQRQLGIGYIILDPIFKGQYSNSKQHIGLTESFREIDPKLGDMNSFIDLIKEARKRGIEIVLTADFNSLSDASEFLLKHKEDILIPYTNSFDKWKNRKGESVSKLFSGKNFYTAVDLPSMYELDLSNKIVINEIKESIKLWLDMGVRGFLLTNIGMYIEDSNVEPMKLDFNFKNLWYSTQSDNGQRFSNRTKLFLNDIRVVMNEVAKRTDKSRVLIVDAGDIGFGLDTSDKLLQYLGDKETGADLIVGREFLNNRGWKLKADVMKSSVSQVSSVKNYLDLVPSDKRKRVALASATSTITRSTDLLQLASPFLVEGTSILYFASELSADCDLTNFNSSNSIYPESNSFNERTDETSEKCNHMIMPWDNSGLGFLNKGNTSVPYILKQKTTVQILTSAGIGETVLELHKMLIKIRKSEPSLQWGTLKLIERETSPDHSYEIFTRTAEGFPTIIVALLQNRLNDVGRVFTFDALCTKFVPILVYPSNENLPMKKEVEVKNVFLKVIKNQSIYVFKCS